MPVRIALSSLPPPLRLTVKRLSRVAPDLHVVVGDHQHRKPVNYVRLVRSGTCLLPRPVALAAFAPFEVRAPSFIRATTWQFRLKELDDLGFRHSFRATMGNFPKGLPPVWLTPDL